jgi:hypothetical protein
LGCHSEGQCAGRLRGYGVGGNVYSARRKGSGNGESEIGGELRVGDCMPCRGCFSEGRE